MTKFASSLSKVSPQVSEVDYLALLLDTTIYTTYPCLYE